MASKRFISFAGLISCLLFIFSCSSQENKKYISPPGYDFSKPLRMKLPLQLDEISGLAYSSKDSSVFAISDDRGAIFRIKQDDAGDIMKWKFSHGADYEDLVLLDTVFYVLQSDGDIIRVIFRGAEADARVYNFISHEGNEFETLYYDPRYNKIILICKDCDADNKKSLTTFSFDPVSEKFSDSSYSIDVKKIARLMKVEKLKFKPSAAAINPKDSMLYIISSVNKMLVITTLDGEPKAAYDINPSVFKQPEGITFTLDGKMVISNEFAGSGTAELLIFKHN